MKNAKLLFGTFAALVMVFFIGCKDMDSFNEESRHQQNDQLGRLVIKLTDAPFPYHMIESATVKIVKVEIRKVSEGDGEGSPFIELPLPDDKDTLEFNLLELMDGVTADLVSMHVDPGYYDLIRLYVAEAGLDVIGGDHYTVKVPSGPQTGIKVFMKPALKVVSSLTTDVVLDFNLEKSFVLKGNANTPAGIKGFNFKPVVKAVNLTSEGTLSGTVKEVETGVELPGASVLLKQDGTDIDSDLTDGAGNYAIDEIPAGLYDVTASLEGYYDQTVEGVEIVEGNLTEQHFELTPITGSLEGVVTEFETETVLSGASVYIVQDDIKKDSAKTDEDGFYSISDIRIGTYNVMGAMDGYKDTIVENVLILEGPPATLLDLELTPEAETTK